MILQFPGNELLSGGVVSMWFMLVPVIGGVSDGCAFVVSLPLAVISVVSCRAYSIEGVCMCACFKFGVYGMIEK